MTKDEISQLARTAGFVGIDGGNGCLRRFAELVAAAELRRLHAEIERDEALLRQILNDACGVKPCKVGDPTKGAVFKDYVIGETK